MCLGDMRSAKMSRIRGVKAEVSGTKAPSDQQIEASARIWAAATCKRDGLAQPVPWVEKINGIRRRLLLPEATLFMATSPKTPSQSDLHWPLLSRVQSRSSIWPSRRRFGATAWRLLCWARWIDGRCALVIASSECGCLMTTWLHSVSTGAPVGARPTKRSKTRRQDESSGCSFGSSPNRLLLPRSGRLSHARWSTSGLPRAAVMVVSLTSEVDRGQLSGVGFGLIFAGFPLLLGTRIAFSHM